MFDDFDTQIQIDEIIPKEYQEWVYFCAKIYKEVKYKKYDPFKEDENA